MKLVVSIILDFHFRVVVAEDFPWIKKVGVKKTIRKSLEDCKMCGPSGFHRVPSLLTKVTLLSSRRHPVAKVPGAMQAPIAEGDMTVFHTVSFTVGFPKIFEPIFGVTYKISCLL